MNERVYVKVKFDDCPDTSYLDADSGRYDDVEDAELRAQYKAEDAERLAAFNRGEWGMVGIVVTRQTQCDLGHWHDDESLSVWGIEDDSGREYGREVVGELIAELDADGLPVVYDDSAAELA